MATLQPVRVIDPGPAVHDLVWLDARRIAYSVTIFSAKDQTGIRVYDMLSGLHSPLLPSTAALQKLAIAPGSKWLVCSDRKGTVSLRDISTIPVRKPLVPVRWTDKELKLQLEQLSISNGLNVLRVLLQVPARAATLLEEQLQPVKKASDKELQLWLKDFLSSSFRARERAEKQLTAQGRLSAPFINEALKQNPGPGDSRRLRMLLKKVIGKPISGERLFHHRAIGLLEMIGTDRALSILRKLATGSPKAELTELAAEAVQRLSNSVER